LTSFSPSIEATLPGAAFASEAIWPRSVEKFPVLLNSVEVVIRSNLIPLAASD